MKLIKSLLGRRQFLLFSITSAWVLGLRRLARAFDLFFGTNRVQASEPAKTTGKKSLRACVVYYSATGSTGKIAGAIYRGMKAAMPCDIAHIKKIEPKVMNRYDVLAIGGPIWFYRETANLRLFISRMPHMAGKLCATFCTHGVQPDGFFYSLAQPLQKKEFTIIGWNDWYGDATHVLHMPQPYYTHGHPDTIDLKEAETFGREMAERAQRIFDGQRDLIPDIPTGPDADTLWVDNNDSNIVVHKNYAVAEDSSSGSMPGGPGEGMPAGGMPPFAETVSTPVIDLDKCVYPKCRACMDNCVVNAINIPLASPAAAVSTAPVLVTQACIHCPHPLCERSCIYDAIAYTQSKTIHVIDMKKCTYPKCTLCVDNCPMNCIDFSQNPPLFHNNCEGCDLCWCLCPVDAISIPNINETHAKLAAGGGDSFFFKRLKKDETAGRFRPLISEDKVGWDHIVYKNPHAPRVVLNPDNYPYHMGNGT